MTGHDPDRPDLEQPWWERGQPPQGYSLPRRRSRKAMLVIATVVVTVLLALTIWAVVTGAGSMGSMPM